MCLLPNNCGLIAIIGQCPSFSKTFKPIRPDVDELQYIFDYNNNK